MSFIRQSNRSCFGLGVSVLLHALVFLGLIFTKCTRPAESKTPVFVEVATVILKSDITHQEQPQAVFSSPQNTNNSPPAVLNTPTKTEKKKENPKPKKVVKKISKKIISNEKVDFPLTPVKTDDKQTNTLSENDFDAVKNQNTTNETDMGDGYGTGNAKKGKSPSAKNGQLSDLIILHRVPPKYPPRAKERRIEGWVQLEITVTESGEVSAVKVIQSNPENVFDTAALQAVKQWKFKPALKAGQAVMRVATLKVLFSMDSPEQ